MLLHDGEHSESKKPWPLHEDFWPKSVLEMIVKFKKKFSGIKLAANGGQNSKGLTKKCIDPSASLRSTSGGQK